LDGGPLVVPASSEIEFHAPHASQRPAHLEETAPHCWQTKLLAVRAIG